MNRRGFTLIELLVTIAILAMVLLAVRPIIRKRPATEQFVQQLNLLMQRAFHNAVVTSRLHKVTVDINRGIFVEAATGRVSARGDEEFEPLKKQYAHSSMPWPKDFEIKNFIIDGFDERGQYSGAVEKFETWFFITPNGITQAVIINIENRENIKLTKIPRPLGLVLNPFSAQFKQYDAFQK